jgi:hypothetical protein
MTYLIIALVIEALLVIHCIRTGRNTIWIWVIILLPFALGAIAYLAMEVIPELLRGRAARRATRSVTRALDPERDLRAAADRAATSGNVAAKQEYGDELVRQGRPAEAVTIYREALTGLYEHDPKLMLGLARAQFDLGEFAAARATLDRLIEANPEFRSPEGHLLYARALEGEGNVAKALDEFRVLAPSFPGAEAAVRFARLLRSEGETAAAQKVLDELLEEARIAPAHYRRVQREWLDAATAESQNMR